MNTGCAAPEFVPGAIAARHIGGEQNQKTGGGGTAAARAHIHRDRHRAVDDLFDDLPHRGVKAARRIDGDQHQRGVLTYRLLDAGNDEFGGDGVDHAIDRYFPDDWGIRSGRNRGEENDRCQTHGASQGRAERADPAPAVPRPGNLMLQDFLDSALLPQRIL
jgi:hypothetical protein